MLPGECLSASKVELGLLKCYQGSGGGGGCQSRVGTAKVLPGECVGAAKVELGLLKCYQGSVWGLPK